MEALKKGEHPVQEECDIKHINVLTALKQFCRTTSLKGVPRVFRSDVAYIRLLWAVAVVCFLSLAMLQAYNLVDKYLQHGTVLYSQQYYYSEQTATSQSAWFPALTICDLQYSWLDMHSDLFDFLAMSGIPAAADFQHQYEVAWQVRLNNSVAGVAGDMYPKEFVNMETLGKESLLLKSHHLDQFVPHCKLLVTGLFKRRLNCTGYVNLRLLSVFEYQTCVRVELNVSAVRRLFEERGYSVYGLSLVLYASRQAGDHQDSGGLVYHHDPGTQPDLALDRSYLTLAPGKLYTVQHEEIVHRRRNSTSMTCTDPSALTYQDISGRILKYTTVSIDWGVVWGTPEVCYCGCRACILRIAIFTLFRAPVYDTALLKQFTSSVAVCTEGK